MTQSETLTLKPYSSLLLARAFDIADNDNGGAPTPEDFITGYRGTTEQNDFFCDKVCEVVYELALKSMMYLGINTTIRTTNDVSRELLMAVSASTFLITHLQQLCNDEGVTFDLDQATAIHSRNFFQHLNDNDASTLTDFTVKTYREIDQSEEEIITKWKQYTVKIIEIYLMQLHPDANQQVQSVSCFQLLADQIKGVCKALD